MDIKKRMDSVSYAIDKFYGNESDRYAVRFELIDIEKYMIENGFLEIYKECKNEYIVHKFLCCRGFVFGHTKIYRDKKSGKIRNRKKIDVPEMNMLNKFICDVIYDYVFVKGYEPLFSITEETV